MASAARLLVKRGESDATVLVDEVDACVRAIVVDAEARLLHTVGPRVLANPTWQRLMARARRLTDDDRTVIGESDESDDADENADENGNDADENGTVNDDETADGHRRTLHQY